MSVLAIHKKSDDGLSDEILRICTGPWGLQSVLCEFETCMSDIFGVEQIQMLKLLEHRWDFNDLIESFLMKYLIKDKYSGSNKIRLRIPISLSRHSEQIKLHMNLLSLNKDDFEKIGEKTIKNIIKQIKTVLAGEMADVETIILCGRLSQSYIVQHALVESFKTKRVVVFDNMHENSAAIKGAMQIYVER